LRWSQTKKDGIFVQEPGTLIQLKRPVGNAYETERRARIDAQEQQREETDYAFWLAKIAAKALAKLVIVVFIAAVTAVGWFLIQSEAPSQADHAAGVRAALVGIGLVILGQVTTWASFWFLFFG
jgi:hypothetical protein